MVGLHRLPLIEQKRSMNGAQFHFLVGQRLVPELLDVAVQPHLGRLALLHMKIGSFGFDDDIEILIDHDALVTVLGHVPILNAPAGNADDFLRSRGEPI